MGILQVTSRVGAAAAPWVAQWLTHFHGSLPFLLMGSLAVTAAISCIALTETKDIETAEELPWTDKNQKRQGRGMSVVMSLNFLVCFCDFDVCGVPLPWLSRRNVRLAVVHFLKHLGH